MTRKTIGLILFWIGSVYFFVGSWLIMWWVAPLWRYNPPEQFEGTIFAYAGLVFMLISFSGALGPILAAIGILLYAHSEKPRFWPFIVFVLGGLLVAFSFFFPPTMAYYPALFGILGGVITIVFFLLLWFWGKQRISLDGAARVAADLQLASYVFFFLTAIQLCALLGNPYSGLYFPTKVIKDSALPVYYSMGTKIMVFLTLGWLFAFLSKHKLRRKKEL
jgi:hypothetical protein